MSKPNGVVAAFMLLLFLTSVVSPKLVVFGSSAHDDEDRSLEEIERALNPVV